MKELFREQNITYNIRKKHKVMLLRAEAVTYGTEILSFRGQRLWQSLQQHIRNAQSIINIRIYYSY